MRVFDTTVTLTVRVEAANEDDAIAKVDRAMSRLAGMKFGRGCSVNYVDGGNDYDEVTPLDVEVAELGR